MPTLAVPNPSVLSKVKSMEKCTNPSRVPPEFDDIPNFICTNRVCSQQFYLHYQSLFTGFQSLPPVGFNVDQWPGFRRRYQRRSPHASGTRRRRNIKEGKLLSCPYKCARFSSRSSRSLLVTVPNICCQYCPCQPQACNQVQVQICCGIIVHYRSLACPILVDCLLPIAPLFGNSFCGFPDHQFICNYPIFHFERIVMVWSII